MSYIVYLFISFIIGGSIAWIMATLKSKSSSVSKNEYEALLENNNSLNLELKLAQQKIESLLTSMSVLQDDMGKYSIKEQELNLDIQGLERDIASISAELNVKSKLVERQYVEIDNLKIELTTKSEEVNKYVALLSTANANYESIKERHELQKQEFEKLRAKFNVEFENIAAKILDEKSAKFTKLNQDNIGSILKPLGDNIESFKKKVEDAYVAESKERFYLGEEVKRLAQLNKQISQDAVNLTNALKGNSKTQGDWGEIILENILERSGLVKDREYFVQEFLRDADGKFLINEFGNRMQPDVIISYPDDRKVIIDSKVSLSAYLRYTQTTDVSDQKEALKEHIKSIKRHIEELSVKSYQDYASSLDFVMMFVPNEPAFMLALKSDPEIWQYAYDRKILLISPTNLIAALKLIVDLWKREYQNRNAMEIADRGAKLYDKFVGFIANLERVGKTLDQASNAYRDAYKQLSTGNDNLVLQTQKLKELGIKSKKEIPTNLLGE